MKKIWMTMAVALLVLLGSAPNQVMASQVPKVSETITIVKSGWVKEEKGYRYYEKDGTFSTGDKVLINGKYYSFDKEGYRVSGWISIKEDWLYFSKEGDNALISNSWLLDQGSYYYLSENGTMLKNTWHYDQGIWYFLQPSGRMAVAQWILWNGTWYYVAGNGSMMENRWLVDHEVWYYLKKGGAMAANQWLEENGVWYYLNPNGSMKVCEWLEDGGRWYYLKYNGAMAVGEWIIDQSTWYYLQENGMMVSNNWVIHRGSWYFLNPNGSMKTGWLLLNGTWYFLKNSGVMACKESLSIEGKLYTFDETGRWIEKAGKRIAIDAGHQRTQNKGKEPVGPGSSEMKQKVSSGTQGVSTRIPEFELNLTVSLKLQKELERRGYEVYMVRTTHDVDISNVGRAKKAADAGADILLRIHGNSVDNSSTHGALTMAPRGDNPYLSSSLIKESQRLSSQMISQFVMATGAKNLGVQQYNNMTGINWSTIPVTIIEMGFMSNPSEDQRMATDSYQNKMVQGIANGVDAYFS